MSDLTPEKLNEFCTYATLDEIQFMREEMPKLLSTKARIVMIGAGPGVLVFPLLEHKKANQWNITIIDRDSVHYARQHYLSGSNWVAARSQFIEWIEGEDSFEVGKDWSGVVDLLIVDGDHSDSGVRRDMEAWLPHMAKAGYVFFHDYEYTGTQWDGQGLPCVKPAVDEVMRTGWKQVCRVGCSALYRKVKT